MDSMEKVSMGMGKPLPPELPDPDIYTVDFDEGDDPQHPYNWTRSSKYDSPRVHFSADRKAHNTSSGTDSSPPSWSASGPTSYPLAAPSSPRPPRQPAKTSASRGRSRR